MLINKRHFHFYHRFPHRHLQKLNFKMEETPVVPTRELSSSKGLMSDDQSVQSNHNERIHDIQSLSEPDVNSNMTKNNNDSTNISSIDNLQPTPTNCQSSVNTTTSATYGNGTDNNQRLQSLEGQGQTDKAIGRRHNGVGTTGANAKDNVEAEDRNYRLGSQNTSIDEVTAKMNDITNVAIASRQTDDVTKLSAYDVTKSNSVKSTNEVNASNGNGLDSQRSDGDSVPMSTLMNCVSNGPKSKPLNGSGAGVQVYFDLSVSLPVHESRHVCFLYFSLFYFFCLSLFLIIIFFWALFITSLLPYTFITNKIIYFLYFSASTKQKKHIHKKTREKQQKQNGC